MINYTVEPSEDRTHIVLTVVGEITGKEMMKVIIEAHELGKEIGSNRYLMDATRARNIDSTFGNYEFAYSDMKQTESIDAFARVAALVSPGDKSHDFVETVLNNAGLFLRIFTEIDKAIDYLKK